MIIVIITLKTVFLRSDHARMGYLLSNKRTCISSLILRTSINHFLSSILLTKCLLIAESITNNPVLFEVSVYVISDTPVRVQYLSYNPSPRQSQGCG